jgi:hypothetical protein
MLGFLQKTTKKTNFEAIKHAIAHPSDYYIINTLVTTEQDCLIQHTLSSDREETAINELINNYDFYNKKIIVYGKNACDESAEKKARQLMGLGFQEVSVYGGGLFEWLLLQDIYGSAEFPTTKRVLDILKYR